ncbi:MAG: ATP-binding cassette domain-containing protein [Lachnospiraceae bacterium]|nr:ATP-binding cassette domain-containing protein [Lachnospiraceae bacterium]
MENAIEVKHISKSFKIYPDRGKQIKERLLFRRNNHHHISEVLKDVSFKIPKGQTVGLIGVNGCGKSTTLKMLTHILYPDSGEILMNGRVSSLLELGAGFHPDMSGRENIYINAAIFGLKRAEIDRRLQSIIDFSELNNYIDNPVRTYSSGMYMRLAFSVAISVDADILLMDEVLAVGDINFQRKCLHKLEEIKQQGKTIVLVSHDAGTISSFCDRAIWIRDGLVAADGDSESVVQIYLDYLETKRTDTSMEADPEARHFGSYELKLKEIQVYRNLIAGEPDQSIYRGRPGVFYPTDPIRLDIRFDGSAHQKDVKYGFHFKIATKNGDIFAERNSFDEGIYVVNPSEDEIIRFLFDALPLPCACYHIYIAIIDENGNTIECFTHYRNLIIESPEGENEGKVAGRGHWIPCEPVKE